MCLLAKTVLSGFYFFIFQKWQELLYDDMLQAGKEEKRLAEEAGHISEDGTPYITVVVDGGWSHRSHGHRYSANSGLAVIIGARTKKLLYLGVKNKVCSTCDFYSRKELPAKEHVCYKNWDKSSSAMESEIIVQGFQQSEQMHGVQYRIFIGDGDSSVHQQVLSRVDYGATIEKRECANHVVKCYTSRLYSVAKASKGNSRHLSGPRIKRIKNGARRAIAHYAKELKNFEGTETEKKQKQRELTKELAEDLINGPRHVFGSHKNCKAYFCDKSKGDNVFDQIPDVLRIQILAAANGISDKSSRLITDDTSNLAETVMSLVAKMSGGKQVNRGQKGSYQHRCHGAGLSFQSGSQWHYAAKKKMTMKSPSAPLKAYTQKMSKLRDARVLRKRRLAEEFSQLGPQPKKPMPKGSAQHYGPACEKPDMPPELFRERLVLTLESLQVSEARRSELEIATRGQSTNARWHAERKTRLTASYFGKVCRRKDSTRCAADVRKILCGGSFTSAAMQYGILNEPVALELYREKRGVTVQPCGMFIDLIHGFLAASPDGLIGTDGIAEVKCPESMRKETAKKAAAKYNDRKHEGTDPKLSRTHFFYYQIQGQLHITGRKFCDFIVYTEQDIDVQRIERDDEFWQTEMEPFLTRFYRECVLPEVVDPRLERSMKIRDPPYILDAIAEKEEKSKKRKRSES